MIFVDGVSKYYGKNTVLNNVSASFPKGKLTSLIGPNGAGKSTLLMSIGKLIKSDSGKILIEENNINNISVQSFAKQVATLRQFQAINVRITVEELVEFGRFPHSHGVLTSEDKIIVQDSISFLELENLKGSFIDELSGGQRQMAFLAMTIAQQTDYILLDEPLNNLDMKHALKIMKMLRVLCDKYNRTIVLVIHDINFAVNYSDHIVAMKSGSVFYSDSSEKIVNEKRLDDLYEIDFEILRSKNGIVCSYFKP